MEDRIYLTPEGKKQLEERLQYYKQVKRPDVVKRIGIAREFGDLSENSEYDVAKQEQTQIDIEIGEMEVKLRNAIVIDERKIDTSKVNVGCLVKLYDLDFDEEVQYKITGTTETNPKLGLISNESPVGKALLGKKEGEVVKVETPAGFLSLKILKISV